MLERSLDAALGAKLGAGVNTAPEAQRSAADARDTRDPLALADPDAPPDSNLVSSEARRALRTRTSRGPDPLGLQVAVSQDAVSAEPTSVTPRSSSPIAPASSGSSLPRDTDSGAPTSPAHAAAAAPATAPSARAESAPAATSNPSPSPQATQSVSPRPSTPPAAPAVAPAITGAAPTATASSQVASARSEPAHGASVSAAPARSSERALQALARRATHAALPRAAPEPVVSKVLEGLSNAISSGRGTVTLRLTPETLGHVKLRVEVFDGAVSARLEASTAQARELLSRSLDLLRSALEAQGFVAARLEVELGEARQGPADHGAAGSGVERSAPLWIDAAQRPAPSGASTDASPRPAPSDRSRRREPEDDSAQAREGLVRDASSRPRLDAHA